MGRAKADTAILAFGALLPFAMAAGKGTGAFVIDMRFIKPLDGELLRALVDSGVRYFVTAEDGVETGGIGEHAARFLGSISDDVKVRSTPRGYSSKQRSSCGRSAPSGASGMRPRRSRTVRIIRRSVTTLPKAVPGERARVREPVSTRDSHRGMVSRDG